MTTQPHDYPALAQKRLADRLTYRTETPILGEDAYHGLAGELVHNLQPTTEASAPSMLLSFLVSFSAMAGRSSCVSVGPQNHHPRLFGAVIGMSSKARKGTALAVIRPILDAADNPNDPFMDTRVEDGIQSAEALIQAAASLGPGPASEASDATDQRLLIIEEELARLLVVGRRQGSTLSPTLRKAWDGAPLSTRTKAEKHRANFAHVGLLGNITIHELNALLSGNDIANGFANRIIFVLSERDQTLPEPGCLPDTTIADFGRRLRDAVRFAHTPREITRTEEFRAAWDHLYRIVEHPVKETGSPAYHALVARASAHQLRLALVYALLDCSPVLKVEHLRAAQALWEYSERSVAHVWGASLGDKRLDALHTALVTAGPAGLDRTQVNKIFSNNLSAQAIDQLVAQLTTMNLARIEKRPTNGRAREVLIAS